MWSSTQFSIALTLASGMDTTCSELNKSHATLKTWTVPAQLLNWMGMVAKRKKEKLNNRMKKQLLLYYCSNWIHRMLWYFLKKIQGKDCWESLWHRKAYWMFSFNLAKTYLEIMETMMSCVLNIGTITMTSNWFAKSKKTCLTDGDLSKIYQ